jgi:hypothetical protein
VTIGELLDRDRFGDSSGEGGGVFGFVSPVEWGKLSVSVSDSAVLLESEHKVPLRKNGDPTSSMKSSNIDRRLTKNIFMANCAWVGLITEENKKP